jgi:RNA polymerase sigma-70 factor (ECF subfamily)
MLDSKKTSTPQLFTGSTVSTAEGARKALDQELMSQVKQGSQQAFRLLFENYKGPVMSYLYQMVQNRKIAEELTQESFLKVYRSRDSYEPRLKFTAWLWTIARNTALDHLRRQSEYLDGHILEEGELSATELLEDPAPSAEESLLTHAENSQVQDCMNALTKAQKEVLLLRTVGDLSYEEIMEQLGLTLPQVKSLLNRAKTSLTRCISSKKESL